MVQNEIVTSSVIFFHICQIFLKALTKIGQSLLDFVLNNFNLIQIYTISFMNDTETGNRNELSKIRHRNNLVFPKRVCPLATNKEN
jgi:hypothetical protein